MKIYGSIFFLLIIVSNTLFAQNNYTNGNEAYYNECLLGFNPVTINNGDLIYTYDSLIKVYRSQDYILIPDLSNVDNGRNIDINLFFGYGIGGIPNDTAFSWDKETILSINDFDVENMFVSPLSEYGMTYAQALQNNNSYCGYDSCYVTIDGPLSSLAYPTYAPANGYFHLWTGEELIDAGDLKNTETIQKISQQQMALTPNSSYCVQKYGQGWRLPTDLEVGHINDSEGVGCGMDSAYMGNSNSYLWTSSLFKTYSVKRWTVRIRDGYWENCAGFLYVANHVKCVFPGFESNPISNEIENHLLDQVVIYPNPGNGIFHIGNDAEIIVYSVLGEIVFADTQISSSGVIDLSFLPNGLYFFHLKLEENTSVIKVMIHK